MNGSAALDYLRLVQTEPEMEEQKAAEGELPLQFSIPVWLSAAQYAEYTGEKYDAIRKKLSRNEFKKIKNTHNQKNQKCTLIHFSELPHAVLKKHLRIENRRAIEKSRSENLLSEKDIETARVRYKVIEEIITGASSAAEVSENKGVPVRTLHRWLRKWNDAPPETRLHALANSPRMDRGVFRSLAPEIERDFNALFLDPNQIPVATIHRYLRRRYGERCPSAKTLQRYASSLRSDAVCLAREGAKKYSDTHEPVLRRDWTSYGIFDVFVADHHQFDLFVQRGRHTFRPWLTAIMDMRSRRIIGWHISAQPCSATIALALKMALCEGIPGIFYRDNGKDFRSAHISGKVKNIGKIDLDRMAEMGLSALGVKIVSAIPYRARSKPIERWFRTLGNWFSKIQPGYCGSSPQKRPERLTRALVKIQKGADDILLSTEELEKRFALWLEEFYHSEKLASLGGRSPNEVWKACVDAGAECRQVTDRTLLRMFEKKIIRDVTTEGVRVNNLHYWNDSLGEYIGKSIIAAWDPSDLSQIHVYTTDFRYICTAGNTDGVTKDTSEEKRKDWISSQRRKKKAAEEYIEQQKKGSTFAEYLRNEQQKPLPPRPKIAVAGITHFVPEYERVTDELTSPPQRNDGYKRFHWQTKEE